MLFSFSQFGAASLRRSKPTFSREGYILFSSYQMFDALKQNLVVKQIFFQLLIVYICVWKTLFSLLITQPQSYQPYNRVLKENPNPTST